MAYLPPIEKPEKKIKVKIFRYNPAVDIEQRYETYEVPFIKTMTVIEILEWLWDHGVYVSFRSNCREFTCGSCAMFINGKPALACKTVAEDDMVLEPLNGFPVLKDLIVDKDKVEKSYARLRLWPEQFTSHKIEIHKDVMDNYRELYYKCVECLVCMSGCPLITGTKRKFAGPMLMLQLARLRDDPYDQLDRPRMSAVNGLYDCSMCHNCKLWCPNELDIPTVIGDLRSNIVDVGEIYPTIRDALESTDKHGNPWGRDRAKRIEWTQDLKIPYASKEMEWLYFVGCTPSYDFRVQGIARALVEILGEAKVNFGILGNEENCCGNPVREMGEKGLFDLLVEKNLGLFDKYSVKRILTTSPHCYDAFKNRYGKTGFEVQHYTQYVAELIDNGKLKLSRKIEKKVTYQDPCNLGKQNGVYDEPRKIIESIPGLKFMEFNRSRERSLCCEGGGGRMWFDAPGGRKLSETHVKEAIDMGVEIILTACPFCLLTIDDAIKTTGYEGSIKVMDIAELIFSTLGHQP